MSMNKPQHTFASQVTLHAETPRLTMSFIRLASSETAESPKTLKSQHEERITLTNITVRTELCKDHISSGETKVGRHGPQADARPSSAKAARGRLYVLDVWKNGFELAWTPGRDFDIPKHFEVTWQATEGGEVGRLLVPGVKREAKVEGLASGTRYLVAVKGQGKQSGAMKAAVTTASLIGFAWSSKNLGQVLHLTSTTTAATTTTMPGIYRAPSQSMADQAVPNQLDATFLIGLAASDITASSFVLSWFGAWEMFDSFLIHYAPENQGKDDQIKDAEGGTGVVEIPGSENSVTLSGLLEATEYEISLTGMRHGKAARTHNLILSTGTTHTHTHTH
uniref:Fibronectin type-III domain-containing protein n=1 Tax=Eptatretus burgeri TaxID=7764 RepID=A0A8C4R4R6_EPTBU